MHQILKRNIEKSLEDNDQFKETYYFNYFNITLTKNGNVIIWKGNGIFTVQKSFSKYSETYIKDELSDDEYITQIGAGKTYFVALTNKQKIYTWRLEDQLMTIPKQKQILNVKGEHQLVTQISVGKDHSIVLTTKGELYSWGDNTYGKCGIGDQNFINKPTKVKFPGLSKNDFIKQLSASDYFNVVLTNHGKVYSWGDNKYFQCGIKNEENIWLPTEIPILLNNEKEKIVLIDTKLFEAIAFTNQNECYIWGEILKNSNFDKKSLPIKSLYPLHQALKYKKLTIARQLMTSSTINELNEYNESPLYIACEEGLDEIIKELVHKMDLNSVDDKSSKNPVDIASAKCNLSLIKLLLNQGLKGSRDSLFVAISNGFTEIVKELVNHQDDLLYEKDNGGNTPLCTACYSAKVDIVKFLLSKGVEVNAQNDFDETPLIISCLYLSLHIILSPEKKSDITADFLLNISLLLKHQANVHLKKNDGLTAAMIASQNCHYALLNLLLTYEPQLIHTLSIEKESLLHLLLFSIN